LSRNYADLVGTDLRSAFVARHNDNHAAELSNHLSTSAGTPSYVIDGMLYIHDDSGGGGGYEYFFRESGSSVEAFTALLDADTSDKDWNLVAMQNLVIEAVTSTPGTITQGRMVVVDGGTGDDGFLYAADEAAYRRVLDNRPLHDSASDFSKYYRLQETISNDSNALILNLASSSSVAWTSLDIPALVATNYPDLAGASFAMALINVMIKDSGGRALVKFRKDGEASDLGYKAVTTVAAETSVEQYGQFWVPLNAGVLNYDLTASGAGTADTRVSVEAVALFT